MLDGAAGGTGGQILISAGLLAKEDGAGTVELGAPGAGVTLDASGGSGTAAGGSGAVGGTSPLSGDPINAIRIEAREDVSAEAELVARGGDAALGGGPGGFGGNGGNVSIESAVGSVELRDTPGAAPIVEIDGGAGDAAAVVVVDGIAALRRPGRRRGQLRRGGRGRRQRDRRRGRRAGARR